MIEAKESLIGNINTSQSLQGSLNKAIEYVSPTTQEKSITPTKEVQEVKPDEGIFALSKVTVEAVTNKIDENITSENIKSGVFILGVEGELKDKQLGSKNITVNGVYNASDDNLDGYDTVTVETSGDAELEASYLSMINDTYGENITKLPEGLTSIGGYAFYFCSRLSSLTLPNTITSIGSYAFYYCSALSKINLPEGLTSIGSNAFERCSALTEITLPSTLTKTNTYAFRQCTNLKRVDNYSSAALANGMFYSDTNLMDLIMRSPTPPSINTQTLSSTAIANKKGYIYVPDESIDLYKSATNWSTYANQIIGISYLNPEPLLLLHAEDFTDSSNSNLGVNNSNILIDDNGKFGKCFCNNTISDENYVEVTLPKPLWSRFTIDFWMKINEYPNETFSVPFAIGEYNDGVFFQFEKSGSTEKLNLWLGGKSSSINTNLISLNEWVHYAVVFDGINYKFYLNGVQQFTLANSTYTSQVNLNLFRSGGSVTLGRSFKGYIDEVRITETVKWTENFTPPTESYE